MWRLFYPLIYFSLKNREKSRIDLWPTLFLALALTLPYALIPGAEFFDQDGFLDKIIPLASALTAFYVAALVAVATFHHPDLDKIITLGSIYILEKDDVGNVKRDPLSRRQFACILFGYLSFISLVISVLSAVAITCGTFAVSAITIGNITLETYRWLNGILIFGMCLAISHMIIVSCLGLYYLMERIHERQPVITTKKPGSGKGEQ